MILIYSPTTLMPAMTFVYLYLVIAYTGTRLLKARLGIPEHVLIMSNAIAMSIAQIMPSPTLGLLTTFLGLGAGLLTYTLLSGYGGVRGDA
jgi:hypothetical protein